MLMVDTGKGRQTKIAYYGYGTVVHGVHAGVHAVHVQGQYVLERALVYCILYLTIPFLSGRRMF